MRVVTALAAAAFLLAACGKPQATTEGGDVDACNAQATRTWRIGDDLYRIDAAAHGATCAEAQATLSLRAPGGAPIYNGTFTTADMPLTFNPQAADSAALNDDLNLWIENQAPGATAAALPAWAANTDAPPGFKPAVTREVYEAARAASDPIFCFPDAQLSHACLAVNPGARTATLLGDRIQSP